MSVATFDTEAFSYAGWNFDTARQRWHGPPGAQKPGLPAVGAAVYWEHPSARVLCLSYDLRDGLGIRRWRPNWALPIDLIAYLLEGRPIEAHNAMFEFLAAHHDLTLRHGFPQIPLRQLRCSMATARVNGLPPKLEKLGEALALPIQKDKEGGKLMDVFSKPRNPTKADVRLRIYPEDDPERFDRYHTYCDFDVASEMAASDDPRMEPMTPEELELWFINQEMNWLGLGVDRAGVENCICIIEQAFDRYGKEMRVLTGGIGPNQVGVLRDWIEAQGVPIANLQEETIKAALARPNLPALAQRALEIRASIGSASVKKLYALQRQLCADSRVRDVLVHHGARTGRITAMGPQPLNLPKIGPKLATCVQCRQPYKPAHTACPWCHAPVSPTPKLGWKPDMVDHVLDIAASRSLPLIEYYFGDAMKAVVGCIRGLFQEDEDHEMVASDYTAIEAVITAELAGEQWRIDAFTNNEPIYLLSASRITGTPVAQYLAYAEAHGEHHPDRKTGKVAELSMGFGGGLGAWRKREEKEGIPPDRYSDDEIGQIVRAWRAASPGIVELWGGQGRGWPGNWNYRSEYFGLEGCFVQAILNPGRTYSYAGIGFYMRGDCLIMRLLSGREIKYPEPRLFTQGPSDRRPGEYLITYMQWRTAGIKGSEGWVRETIYGGKIMENLAQSISADITRTAIRRLRDAGYAIVLQVYDQIVCRVPRQPPCPARSDPQIIEVERILALPIDWARSPGGRPWPIRASDGWRSPRYQS